MTAELKSPPLVEAILEIKWDLQKKSPDTLIDPGYKLASGRLYDRVKKKFKTIQTLPINNVPEEITPYAVRHQFRVDKNSWPLVQFGPGVATVNYTSPYTWRTFRETIKYFIPHLVDSYSDLSNATQDIPLKINSVMLRYINATEFNWEEKDTLPFLRDSFHTCITLPDGIVKTERIAGNPINVNFQMGYPINDPHGYALLRFSTGSVGQANGIIWELVFLSLNEDAPQLSDLDIFVEWATKAHEIIDNWFNELIKGDLIDQYKKGTI